MPQNINWFFISDGIPPNIIFSDENPTSKFLFSATGSVHVTVEDPGVNGRIDSSAISLMSDSVGEIDSSSITVVSTNKVEFDVINISATGYVKVDAIDYFGNETTATNGEWLWSAISRDPTLNNDRLINMVNLLPTWFKDQEIYEFVNFFQSFLNLLYKQTDPDTLNTVNISNLKKIERLSTLHSPQYIDIELIQYLASFMGYDVDLSKGDLGLFTTSAASYNDLTTAEITEANKYLRLIVSNLPYWYQIKTTENAIRILLLSFGIIGDLVTLFTDDYENNWFAEFRNDNIDIVDEFGTNRQNYYPSSHFEISINVRLSYPNWMNNIDGIVRGIKSIKPVNTVFDKIGGVYPLEVVDGGSIIVPATFETSEYMFIDWVGPTAN